ncbi:FadR/GntR family transcriptional regulator [Streptomyces fuscigenes]|uniref:FadR/GntR family transcriptional regulator n=1 Tax=Streptomyces fuscigenes TaxID=1528880 RepID=UPI001F3F1B6D|nr:FCD domain-containing protein [Streptomyces fuscigenes]MCF3963813.1 FCD domain-containing protein [Streptomyces fuscigenes]
MEDTAAHPAPAAPEAASVVRVGSGGARYTRAPKPPAAGRPGGARANQRALQAAVREFIVAKGLAAGAPLPTETELMAELGVSRHPLREAMKALEAVGIVDIRHGYGTYVGSVPFSALEAGLTFRTALSVRGDHSDIRNLVEVREVLETGLAGRVLAAYDLLDADALEGHVAAMERAAAEGRFTPEHDWAFHEALYRPLGNELVLDLLQVFWKVFAALDPDLPGAPDTPAATARWHRGILEALRSRDEQALHEALADHFRGIRARLAGTAG